MSYKFNSASIRALGQLVKICGQHPLGALLATVLVLACGASFGLAGFTW